MKLSGKEVYSNLTEPEVIFGPYMNKLEKIIRAKPEDRLWLHKRRKLKRE